MRKYIFIIGFLLLPGLMAESWAQSQMQTQRPNQSFGQLESELSTRNLSIQQLSSFEKRGLEKIQEFIDYQQLIGDDSYDEKMRKHAIKLALSSFIDSSQITQMNPDASIPISDYLQQLMTGKAKALSAQNLEIQNPFESKDSQTFKGKAVLTLSTGETRSIVLWLLLKKKEIGSQTLEVWTILLGDFL